MQLLDMTGHAPGWKWWLPPVYSTFGGAIDTLYWWIFVITMVTFVIVEALLVWFCIKYRKDPKRKAVYVHGSHKLEVAWTLIPALILVGIGAFSSSTWALIKNPASPNYPKEFGATVRVTAKQFTWNVTYPGADGKFDTDDDFSKENQLNVPVGENIQVLLTSQDVIHSFFCPVLRLKQDAVPGFTGRVWFNVTRATDPGPDGKNLTFDEVHVKNPDGSDSSQVKEREECYEIACAELCGLGHYRMRMELRAVPRADWEAWVRAESAKKTAK